MNKIVLMGRTTKDADVRYSQGSNSTAVAKITLAVDRKFKKDGEATADFINCTAFGKTAEVIEKYVLKGTKIAVVGRIQTGSYTNKDGQKVFTTDVMIEDLYFCESKNNQNNNEYVPQGKTQSNNNMDFMNIPDGIADENPFN